MPIILDVPYVCAVLMPLYPFLFVKKKKFDDFKPYYLFVHNLSMTGDFPFTTGLFCDYKMNMINISQSVNFTTYMLTNSLGLIHNVRSFHRPCRARVACLLACYTTCFIFLVF